LNGSTLSSASTGSALYSWSFRSNTSVSLINGIRELIVPLTVSANPGHYWLGYWLQTSNGGTSNGSMALTHYGASSWARSGQWGDSAASLHPIKDGLGYYGTVQTTLMESAALTDIVNTVPRQPWVLFRATGA
jgi:hypothetical protein